ncbi:MAG TPA: hypothetical protein VF585_06160 [Chthoniobacterales bacterium]|jgi:hypothetical protein
MKHPSLFLLTGLLALSSAQAGTILEDFNGLTTLPYIMADEGPWSDDTASFSSTTATIANFGSGQPSGGMGNGFVYWLGGAQDWTTNNFVILTGFTLPENATSTLNFYIEDDFGNVSISTQFALSDFTSGNTVAVPIVYGAVTRTDVAYWGVQGQRARRSRFRL